MRLSVSTSRTRRPSSSRYANRGGLPRRLRPRSPTTQYRSPAESSTATTGGAGATASVRVHDSIEAIGSAAWAACAGADNPFLYYDFLQALEESGCVSPRTGWTPQHLAVQVEVTTLDQLRERFRTNIVNFMDSVEAFKHYPCVKRAWVEYLGEHPEPAIDRVQ